MHILFNATHLVTLLQFHSNLYYYAVPFLANYGTIPYSLLFTLIAALLQAVLQMNTEPFRNGLVETTNRTIRTNRKPSTSPKWSKMMIKYIFWACFIIFVLFYVIRRNIIVTIIVFLFWKKCFIFCFYYHLLCRRGNKHFDVHLWWIRLVFFSSKGGKDAVCEGRNGWKSVYFPPELASFVFVVSMIKVLFPICTLTWCVNKYVSRWWKV